MPSRFARYGWVFLLAAAALLAPAPAAFAQSTQQIRLERLETARATLERLGAAARAAAKTDRELEALRRQALKLRDELRGHIQTISPRHARASTRLKQLGAPPAADAPPEDPALTGERANLGKLLSELDAILKQAKVLVLRADQLADQINDKRRDLFARRLLTRHTSPLDPAFWSEVAIAIPYELNAGGKLLRTWQSHLRDTGSLGSVMAVLLTLIAVAAALIMLRRWSVRWLAGGVEPATRFSVSLGALIVYARTVLTMPAAVLAIVMALEANNLIPPRGANIGFGLVAAVAIASFGRGVANALLTVGAAEERHFALDPRSSRLIGEHLVWGGRLLAVAVIANIVHKTLVASVVMTVATSALLAIVIAVIAANLLWRLRHKFAATEDEAADPRLRWLRAAGWLVVAAIAAALAGGYIGLAAFLAGRLLAAIALFGLLYVCLVFVDAVFTEVLSGDTPRGRALGAMLGLKARGIELIGTLLSGLIRLVLVLVAIFPLLGPWGLFAADFFGALRDAAFAVRIGDLTISFTAILSAIALMALGILAIRAVQRWMETRLLPHAGLEPGLQNSVSKLLGYVGFITLTALVLTELGIDLQKVALIAGALSVGIGFGLQSIVSNFVSGLILLAERPIRVGDWVVVKDEQGYVRRISVRATEIETFDRASVIIPNSDFITSVVKNWTHANTTMRVVIKVGVSYKSDPEKVRDVLIGCAREHPQILQTPAPSALLLKFGDSSLDFELRCYLANVAYLYTVTSDLHFAIFKRFHEEHIEIPFPQRDVHMRGGAPAPDKGQGAGGA